MRNHLFILTAIAILCFMAVPQLASVDDADTAEVIGIGYDSYSPYGSDNDLFELELEYYSNGILKLMVTLDESQQSDPAASHMGKDSRVSICQKDHDDTRERTEILVSTRVPMKESLALDDFKSTILEAGIYVVQIRATTNDALMVESVLIVGEIVDVTIQQPATGSVDKTEVRVISGTTMVASGTELTFKYTKGSTTIDLDKVTATPPSGLSIDGWYVGDTKITSQTVSSDTSVEVRWTSPAYDYKLTFDANGGTGAPDVQTYSGPETTHTFTISSTKPTKSGQEFKGWSESATGTAQYQPGATITLQIEDPEKTLYAVWGTPPVPPGPTDVYTYRVTYDANGGSGAPEAQTITTSAFRYLFTVPDTIPVKDGYRFDGWSETNPGTVKYVPGDTIELQYTAPLLRVYAVWETEGPAIKEIISEVDLLDLVVGDDVTFDVTTVPAGKESSLIWTTSDPTVVIVTEDGSIKAVGTGTATITISSPDDKTTLRIPVTVTSEPSPQQAKKVIHTDNGGSVVVFFHADSEGKLIPTNPVEINPGTDGNISEQQYEIADSYMTQILRSGVLPDTIVYGREQNMIIPAELLESVAVDGGSLTVEFYDEVRITLSAAVISELGYGEDIELIVIPVAVESEDLPDDIDVSGLGDDVKVYDIYMTRNGERITRTLDNGIGIGIDYPLEDGRTPEKVHLYYVDVDPFEEYAFIYQDDAVNFTVHHFSHYAIAYDAEKNDLIIWIGVGAGILVLLLIFILLFLFVLRKKIRLDLDGGTYVFVPEGWKSESNSVIYRRFKKGDELVIPKVDARMGGATVTGWLPDPPKEVEKSETFKAIWSNQNDL